MNKALIQRNRNDDFDNEYISPVKNHWEPNIDEEYFYIEYPSQEIRSTIFTNDDNFKIHQTRILNGNCYKNKESATAKIAADEHNKEVDANKRKSSFSIKHNMDMIQNMFIGIAESEYNRGYDDGFKEGYKKDVDYTKYEGTEDILEFIINQAEKIEDYVHEFRDSHYLSENAAELVNDIFTAAQNVSINSRSILSKIIRKEDK